MAATKSVSPPKIGFVFGKIRFFARSMSRRDRPRSGPEEAPLNPASHPPPPHGPCGLPGQRWRQARGS